MLDLELFRVEKGIDPELVPQVAAQPGPARRRGHRPRYGVAPEADRGRQDPTRALENQQGNRQAGGGCDGADTELEGDKGEAGGEGDGGAGGQEHPPCQAWD